jgi:D-alanine-D-alanine ligase
MKRRIGILFGGKSAEHEVSLQSAKNVIEALNPEKFEAVLIGIDKQGGWHQAERATFLVNAENPSLVKLNSNSTPVALLPGPHGNQLTNTETRQSLGKLDAVFPVLHGPLGEDGTIQGLLRLADIPFVGPDVLGSAIGMDKDVMKRLLRDAGIPIAPFLAFHDHQRDTISFEKVVKQLGLPHFIKPANMGSSVGVSKVHTKEEFEAAVNEAFAYDTKILIEQEVKGMEVECAVLGNDHPKASLPGRVVVNAEFYSYEAKYIDEHGAVLEIPAQLPEEVITKVQEIAIKTFVALTCQGMGRVDMFVTPDYQVFVNEINTIPGFTEISMYPKMWEASGLSYTDLITELIDLAIERHTKQAKLKSSYV